MVPQQISVGLLVQFRNADTILDVYKRQVVNNPLPPQPKPAATLVVEEFTAPSIYLDVYKRQGHNATLFLFTVHNAMLFTRCAHCTG